MTPAIALFTIALILLQAGIKNQSPMDVILGKDRKKSKGEVEPFDSRASYETATDPNLRLQATPGAARAGTSTIDGHPVALWIVPYVKWARRHGWKGVVTSGYRPPWQVVTPSPGLPVAPQGKSNHSKLLFPGGAIDVTRPDEFAQALRSFPGPVPLKQGLAIGDPIHFSSTGR